MLRKSAIAERIHGYRGLFFTANDFLFKNYRWSMACVELLEEVALLDFTDPKILVEHGVSPLDVATKDRRVSQRLAVKIYDQGAPGFLWGSSLEPRWTNASLFASRTLTHLKLREPIFPLSLTMPDFIEAAKQIGVFLKQGH